MKPTTEKDHIEKFLETSKAQLDRVEELRGLMRPPKNNRPPQRRLLHLYCKQSDCESCLDDHKSLNEWFGAQIGDKRGDWLGDYRKFLEARNIPAELNGWASPEAFTPMNAWAFVWIELLKLASELLGEVSTGEDFEAECHTFARRINQATGEKL